MARLNRTSTREWGALLGPLEACGRRNLRNQKHPIVFKLSRLSSREQRLQFMAFMYGRTNKNIKVVLVLDNYIDAKILADR